MEPEKKFYEKIGLGAEKSLQKKIPEELKEIRWREADLAVEISSRYLLSFTEDNNPGVTAGVNKERLYKKALDSLERGDASLALAILEGTEGIDEFREKQFEAERAERLKKDMGELVAIEGGGEYEVEWPQDIKNKIKKARGYIEDLYRSDRELYDGADIKSWAGEEYERIKNNADEDESGQMYKSFAVKLDNLKKFREGSKDYQVYEFMIDTVLRRIESIRAAFPLEIVAQFSEAGWSKSLRQDHPNLLDERVRDLDKLRQFVRTLEEEKNILAVKARI